MRKLLTDAHCKALRPPTDGRVEIADLRCAGLSFRVTPAGARSWAFRFRDPTTGASSRATIGNFPDVGLADARARANEMRAAVEAGRNPVIEKRSQRVLANQRSFAAVAERYMTEHSRRKKKSWGDDERNLNLHVLPLWRSRQLEDIRRADIIALVEDLVQDGKPVLANRVQSLISSLFSFALDADLVEANPCARLRKRGTERASRRVMSDAEIRLLWRRGLVSPVSPSLGLAMRLQLLTGTRPGEVAAIRQDELDALNDPEKASWTIPATRTKNSRGHYVPLSAFALKTIAAAQELSGDNEFLFPSPVGNGPIKGHALAVAMRRLSESENLTGPGSDTWKAHPPTPHDLRRTFATRLSELGVAKEDRDACLNHTPQDVGSCHYDLYQRANEKRSAFGRFSRSMMTVLQGGGADHEAR
jgi:integrase